MGHIEQVLKRFHYSNICLKPSKCHIVKFEVKYLGHIVSADGLSPNPGKIKAVKDFPIPKTTSQVRSFLGLATYYRRFIQNFSKIVTPLNCLTSKNVKFHWGDNCKMPLKLCERHSFLPLSLHSPLLR